MKRLIERIRYYVVLAVCALWSLPAAADCPRGDLDQRFCDADGDMIADTPTDVSKQIDPDTLIFAYTPVEDPAVYKTAWADFLDHLEKETNKKVVFFPVQSNAAQIEAMRSGRLHIAGFNTGSNPLAVNCAGFSPFTIMASENGSFGYEMEIITYPGSGIDTVADIDRIGRGVHLKVSNTSQDRQNINLETVQISDTFFIKVIQFGKIFLPESNDFNELFDKGFIKLATEVYGDLTQGVTTFEESDVHVVIYKAIDDAYNTNDKEAQAEARKDLAAAFRLKAKSVNLKYIAPPKSTNFAIIYVPTEGLFAELSSYRDPKTKELLLQELRTKYKVTISGPNTLSALLQSYHLGFQTLKVQQHATQIYSDLRSISSRFEKHFDGIKDLRKKLEQAMQVTDSFGRDARSIINTLGNIKDPEQVEIASKNENVEKLNIPTSKQAKN